MTLSSVGAPVKTRSIPRRTGPTPQLSMDTVALSADPGQFPALPDGWGPTQENFSGTTVTGISQQFLQNLTTDPNGNYYGAGARYPDIMSDPSMHAFVQKQNQITMARLGQAYNDELAAEKKAGGTFGKPPDGWVNPDQSVDGIDASDGDQGSIQVGMKSVSITGDGAPNRKVVISGLTGSKTMIPESKDYEIEQLIHVNANGADKYALVGSQDGADVLHIFDDQGNHVTQIPLPGYGTLHDVRPGPNPSQIQFLYDTPISPPQAVTVDLATNEATFSPLPGYNFNTDKFVTDKLEVPFTDINGKSQTVPVFVSHAKDLALNGKNRALMSIYGGFDIAPQYLRYLPNEAAWLARGGITVDPVLPGDGGLGSTNYQEGLLQGIQNTDLALAAISKKLQELGYSSPQTTGIYGRSNGGMIVGSVLNNYPNLFGAAVPESGVHSLFDSPTINVDTGSNWEGEFGDPTDPQQVGWMSKLDVLNNLSAARHYPPTLVEFGTLDGVVNAGNSITYATTRQAMNNGETLLFGRTGEGHDPSSLTLQTAFLWDRLGSA
ncbi:MAG: prolyl oligopeptidase family serine peptidase [Candidatus Xenobia bacterium]